MCFKLTVYWLQNMAFFKSIDGSVPCLFCPQAFLNRELKCVCTVYAGKALPILVLSFLICIQSC